jgi:hypothetical protein
MGDAVAQVHQRGEQPVEEHQPVPGTGSDRPSTRAIDQSRVLACLPARPSSATSSASTSRDSPVTRRSATAAARASVLDTLRPCSVPHEEPLPLTMHEVVGRGHCLGGVVLPRSTSWVGRIVAGETGSPRRMSRTSLPASSPWRGTSWWTVDRSRCSARGWLSMPMTEMSPGTLRPARRSVTRAPKAISLECRSGVGSSYTRTRCSGSRPGGHAPAWDRRCGGLARSSVGCSQRIGRSAMVRTRAAAAIAPIRCGHS